ncbi:protein ACCELERATED CELL DEATH 6-like [Aristolochia californica]|uniref:protein ACCELERATED CELL DEATH 6-like n=1 Tax=Aristolochia californica TaxID=171875 RepID=UPI0035D7D1C6
MTPTEERRKKNECAEMDPALHKAAIEGKVELLRRTVGEKSTSVLLPPSPHKNFVLHIASRFGHEEFAGEVMRLCPSLLCAPDSRLNTPLHVTARSGKASIVRLLISQMKNTPGDIEEDIVREKTIIKRQVIIHNTIFYVVQQIAYVHGSCRGFHFKSV